MEPGFDEPRSNNRAGILTTSQSCAFKLSIGEQLSLILFYFIFLSALGLHCCMRAFSICGELGLLFSPRWLLLLRSMGSGRVGFSSCSTWAQQLGHTGPGAQA